MCQHQQFYLTRPGEPANWYWPPRLLAADDALENFLGAVGPVLSWIALLQLATVR